MQQQQQKWEFDDGVASIFDDMLARSIPQYDLMRALVTDFSLSFLPSEGGQVLDLGCSRGNQIEAIAQNSPQTFYLGLDCSTPMVAAAKEKFKGQHNILIKNLDLREDFPPGRFNIVLSVLTLQFTPIEYRLGILQKIYDCLLPGGCFILVEKILGASAIIDSFLVEKYLALKGGNGYSQEEITRKKLALEGILVPVTDSWNRDLLKTSGFNQVDCFWRVLNFAGYLAVKNPL